VWDRQTLSLRLLLTPPPGITPDNAALVFSPDGTRLAFASGEDATLWDLAAGRRLDSWHLPLGLDEVLAFDPSGLPRPVRLSTQQGTRGPVRGVPYDKYPRVGRFRELLAGGSMRTTADVTVFNRGMLKAEAPQDLNFVVVDGISA